MKAYRVEATITTEKTTRLSRSLMIAAERFNLTESEYGRLGRGEKVRHDDTVIELVIEEE